MARVKDCYSRGAVVHRVYLVHEPGLTLIMSRNMQPALGGPSHPG